MNQRTEDPTRISISLLVDKFFIHPEWDETTLDADIALIGLNTIIPYTSKGAQFMRPIVLVIGNGWHY